MPAAQRASGALFGMAFGDALGAPTEFLTVQRILQQFPPAGPVAPEGNPALVTDDTQMALAVGEALLEAPRPFTAATLEPPLRRAFVAWYNSPDNTRAPGATCLSACANLEKGKPWIQATIAGSKGCGANMRVAPVGLLPPTTADKDASATPPYAAMAQFQAALTHGHPTGLAAADLTAMTVHYFATGGAPADLPRWLRQYAQSQRRVYHTDWLGTLWQRPGITSPEQFIERGWDECLAVLDQLPKFRAKRAGSDLDPDQT